jgi:hypothetical protein
MDFIFFMKRFGSVAFQITGCYDDRMPGCREKVNQFDGYRHGRDGPSSFDLTTDYLAGDTCKEFLIYKPRRKRPTSFVHVGSVSMVCGCTKPFTESRHRYTLPEITTTNTSPLFLKGPPLKRSGVSSEGKGDAGDQRPCILAPRALRSPPQLLRVRPTPYALFFFLSNAKRYLGFFPVSRSSRPSMLRAPRGG